MALSVARGEYLVVYDAEDEPDREQLRLAASRFAADPHVDALQARLTIANAADGWLPRMFAIEYAALFDIVNPGLAALDLPIALGGTSNHFRTRVLRRVGGWDAWNVTEDADLGIRLARFGARVGALVSDTAEEAPNELGNWFRQRVRWQKGWMQTLIVHTRRPVRLFRELGFRHGVCALLLIGGTVITGLLGPPLLADALLRGLFEFFDPAPASRFSDVVTYILTLVGAQTIIIPAAVAMRRRNMPGKGFALLTMPAYYGLVFLATWVGLFELARRPFHWHKTEHGKVGARAAAKVTASTGRR
jgi:cellulose synthase/poly-beta-1,6-N-acetylglucosamine synthase-like glycosyltransferase